MARHDAQRAIAAIWHIEAATVIGAVARIVRDIGFAEEFAQDALVAALESWPKTGIPDNPGAWLTTAAKRRALDHLRHEQIAAGKAADVSRELDFQHAVASEEAAAAHEADLDDALHGGVGDDVLRLIFTACHPVLSPEARCA